MKHGNTSASTTAYNPMAWESPLNDMSMRYLHKAIILDGETRGRPIVPLFCLEHTLCSYNRPTYLHLDPNLAYYYSSQLRQRYSVNVQLGTVDPMGTDVPSSVTATVSLFHIPLAAERLLEGPYQRVVTTYDMHVRPPGSVHSESETLPGLFAFGSPSLHKIPFTTWECASPPQRVHKASETEDSSNHHLQCTHVHVQRH